MTPVGGLSLIAHSLILVVSMIYSYLKHRMERLGIVVERPRVTYILSSQSGDSILRRALSYSIVGLVFIWVSSGAFGMVSARVAEIDFSALRSVVLHEGTTTQTAAAAVANPPRVQ